MLRAVTCLACSTSCWNRAKTVEDFSDAQPAIDAITTEVEVNLTRSPFIYRKVGESAFPA